MIIWLVIGIGLIVLMVLFKMKEIRHKFGLVAIALIVLFLVFSFSHVYKSNKPDLTTFDGISQVTKLYFSWLGGVFKNLGKVTGFAINQDWGLNSTYNNISNSSVIK